MHMGTTTFGEEGAKCTQFATCLKGTGLSSGLILLTHQNRDRYMEYGGKAIVDYLITFKKIQGWIYIHRAFFPNVGSVCGYLFLSQPTINPSLLLLFIYAFVGFVYLLLL